MDHDLLSAVLGRRISPHALIPARVGGYRRLAVCGAVYPVVLSRRGASVSGLILEGVSSAERDRLCAYEGDGYQLERALAEIPGKPLKRVLLFKPKPGEHVLLSKPWSLARWRLREKSTEMKALVDTCILSTAFLRPVRPGRRDEPPS
jgi:hypothetical protein